jgi:tetratricopeptide (TPR) repeat protein
MNMKWRHNMKTTLVSGLLIVVTAFASGPAFGNGKQLTSGEADAAKVQQNGYGGQLGTVRFPVSCTEAARQQAERGLALLHHMTYEGARATFATATETDPDCAMGYWGQAMSFIHPLWSDPPSKVEFEKGQALAQEAKTRGQKSDWEQAYIAAVEAYYAPGRNRDEKTNLARFEKAWQQVYKQFPKDPEAACFYALAHMAMADPADKSYTKQKQAADIAEQVQSRIPDHPGAHHYIIHAYDYPPLAEDALEVARSYGEIAPEVPHALHMPSHIFTRLGLWQESIAMNQRSAAAALKHPADDKISLHHPHALDYLAYAYLQRAEDDEAQDILNKIESVDGPIQAHLATAYTFAAVPARFALERHQWDDAAELEPRTPSTFEWDQFPAMEAIAHFARALGAARSGHEEVARQAIDTLSSLRDQTAKTSAYWAKQIDIQRLAAQAWLTYQQGNQEAAVNTMRQAAEMEAATEKHPVTPGEILPARELLGDMLLASGRYEEAQTQYLAALERSPNRFNSLYGAARAAEQGGDANKAALYYRKLVEVTAADAKRERLQQAKTFLANN